MHEPCVGLQYFRLRPACLRLTNLVQFRDYERNHTWNSERPWEAMGGGGTNTRFCKIHGRWRSGGGGGGGGGGASLLLVALTDNTCTTVTGGVGGTAGVSTGTSTSGANGCAGGNTAAYVTTSDWVKYMKRGF